jgi:hypothetical protein
MYKGALLEKQQQEQQHQRQALQCCLPAIDPTSNASPSRDTISAGALMFRNPMSEARMKLSSASPESLRPPVTVLDNLTTVGVTQQPSPSQPCVDAPLVEKAPRSLPRTLGLQRSSSGGYSTVNLLLKAPKIGEDSERPRAVPATAISRHAAGSVRRVLGFEQLPSRLPAASSPGSLPQ